MHWVFYEHPLTRTSVSTCVPADTVDAAAVEAGKVLGCRLELAGRPACFIGGGREFRAIDIDDDAAVENYFDQVAAVYEDCAEVP